MYEKIIKNGEVTLEGNIYTVWDETYSDIIVKTEHYHEAMAHYYAYCHYIETGEIILSIKGD